MSTAVAFRFPAGRYHATPWDSHVNEAEVEWPPSAWRVLRALIAVWHRKMDPGEFPEKDLEALVHGLAGERPFYRLPAAVHSHSRHYMPERAGRSERRTLVFDAFARVDRSEDLVMAWPEVDLDDRLRGRLSELLGALGYLGRAESWVEARLLEDWDGAFDCGPVPNRAAPDHGRGDLNSDRIRLPVPRPPGPYADWRGRKLRELGLDEGRLNKGQTRLKATLPERLVDALRLETGQIRKEGWSQPPGLEFVLYHRPSGALEPQGGAPRVSRVQRRRVTTARLILSGKPLPRVEDAVKIGEVVRLAAIRKADDLSPEEGEVPAVLSGHDMPDDNLHDHALYLPEDADGDGRLDHVIVHAAGGLDEHALSALYELSRIWLDQGAEWRVALEDYGVESDFHDHAYLDRARVWASVTPYLHPWYRKKGFMHPDQIAKECRLRGLPEPNAERLSGVRVGGRNRRAVHFHRFRSRRGLRQPDTRGSFWRLTFPEPIPGPLALGFGCHFGLGMFRAEAE